MITFFACWQLNIRAVTVIQLITVTVLMGLSGVVHGDMHPNWNGAFIGAAFIVESVAISKLKRSPFKHAANL